MKHTAAQIRHELENVGLKASVRCIPGYKIAVEADANADLVKDIVKMVYHSQPHHWLCIRVNNDWLPMRS